MYFKVILIEFSCFKILCTIHYPKIVELFFYFIMLVEDVVPSSVIITNKLVSGIGAVVKVAYSDL